MLVSCKVDHSASCDLGKAALIAAGKEDSDALTSEIRHRFDPPGILSWPRYSAKLTEVDGCKLRF